MPDVCIAENERCPKCDCGAVHINELYEFECGFCGYCWWTEHAISEQGDSIEIQRGANMRYIEYKLPQIGDIVLVKSFSALGWILGAAFRCASPLRWESGKRPSNHNGIVGFDENMEMAVFESIGCGFVATPFLDYIADVHHGCCEIKIARLSGGFPASQFTSANRWLNSQIGTPYDYTSYISHIWRTFLRLTPLRAIHSKSRFYCTEAVQEFYRITNQTVFEDTEMIAPIHVEKAIAEGAFEIIAECKK